MVLLIGIVLPILGTAKANARQASDLSNLRQLGQGAMLYQEQAGEMPLGCPTLVDSKFVPSDICSALNDSSREGLANSFVRVHASVSKSYGQMITTYKNSFLGLRELLISQTQLRKDLEEATGTGWLVDLSSAKPSNPFGLYWSGTYRRLTNDGSVVTRAIRGTPVVIDGKTQVAYLMIDLFGDRSGKGVF